MIQFDARIKYISIHRGSVIVVGIGSVQRKRWLIQPIQSPSGSRLCCYGCSHLILLDVFDLWIFAHFFNFLSSEVYGKAL